MYLRRKIDSFLEDWGKNGEKLPLIVKGVRQIGKTESIRRRVWMLLRKMEIGLFPSD